MRFIPPITLSWHSQTISCFWAGPSWHAHHRRICLNRRPTRTFWVEGWSEQYVHLYWTRNISSYRSYKLCIWSVTILHTAIDDADAFFAVCHHNSLLIYGSLRTPTLDRFAKVTHISTFMSLVACMTLAISAYVVFTDKTQGNILNNFPLVSPRLFNILWSSIGVVPCNLLLRPNPAFFMDFSQLTCVVISVRLVVRANYPTGRYLYQHRAFLLRP